MAESRNIDTVDKSLKQLINELSAHVSSLGLSVILRLLKVSVLKEMGRLVDWEDDRLPTGKAMICKKIQDTMEDMTPKKFLDKLDSGTLRNIIVGLELEPFLKKNYVELILQTADEMGLENFFSSFPTTKIKQFVKYCGLKVDTDSLDFLLRALVDQESVKSHYEAAPGEYPSKVKPEIDKNITVVDLYNHYFREDLSSWCAENSLTASGSKKELVERTRRSFDGKLEERDTPKKKKTSDQDDSNKNKKKDDKKRKKINHFDFCNVLNLRGIY
jgi:hypothetical protein